MMTESRYNMLIDTAILQAENLRHLKGTKRTEAIERLFITVLNLKSRRKMNDADRQAYVKKLMECGYPDESNVRVQRTMNDVLEVNAVFDMRELGKRFVW